MGYGGDVASNPVTVSGDLIAGDKVLGNKTVGLSAEEVAGLLARISREFQPRPFEGRCPYVGLAAFGEQDADLFFGREALVADLLARVKASRFIVVAGPSGSGKSSLVRAGLLPVLRRGVSHIPAIAAQVIPRSDTWLYAVLKPGRDPLDALARAV